MYSSPHRTLATASVSVVLTNSMRIALNGLNVAGPASAHVEPSNVMVTVAVGATPGGGARDPRWRSRHVPRPGDDLLPVSLELHDHLGAEVVTGGGEVDGSVGQRQFASHWASSPDK